MAGKRIRGAAMAILFLAMIIGSFTGERALAASPAPPDAAAIQKQIDELDAFLDSDEYAARTTWAEHVVLAYEATQGREPTAFEFQLLAMFHDKGGIKWSNVLAVALCGDGTEISWDQCRQFAAKASIEQFKATPATTSAAQKLLSTSAAEVEKAFADDQQEALNAEPFSNLKSQISDLSSQSLPDPGPPGEVYNTYFGYLHAHSNLSDGQGTPLEAYTYARDQGGLDFFSLTDHGELMIFWPWEDSYQQLKDAAEQTYDPGRYATLWGFEYSNPVMGHINVINSDDYTNTFAKPRLRGFYEWLSARPEAFGQFNHPGLFNATSLKLLHFPCFPEAIDQMVGIELWNENSSFDQYYYNAESWTNGLSYWDVGNRNGWYLGASGGQDNHRPNWGTENQCRVGVLAKNLTREDIIDAFQKRRFYSTEDKDLYLDFRCAGYPMGSRLSDEARTFDVTATDGSGDVFEEARLYRNGVLIDTKTISGNAIQVSFTDTNGGDADYYYVIVKQTDDNDGDGRNDEAISSPIWFNNPGTCQSPAGCVGAPVATSGGAFDASLGAMVMAAILAALLLNDKGKALIIVMAGRRNRAVPKRT